MIGRRRFFGLDVRTNQEGFVDLAISERLAVYRSSVLVPRTLGPFVLFCSVTAKEPAPRTRHTPQEHNVHHRNTTPANKNDLITTAKRPHSTLDPSSFKSIGCWFRPVEVRLKRRKRPLRTLHSNGKSSFWEQPASGSKGQQLL